MLDHTLTSLQGQTILRRNTLLAQYFIFFEMSIR